MDKDMDVALYRDLWRSLSITDDLHFCPPLPPLPHPQANGVPHFGSKGGDTLACGGEVTQFRRWTEILVLYVYYNP